MPDNPKLIDKLATHVDPVALALVAAVRAQSEAEGLRAFLVGGTVRDLLLNRASLDVDIVVEGDAAAIARQVASATGARLVKTTAFGTATLRTGSFSLDLATARAEIYTRPGALPKVRPAHIDDDLLRRDFTINAMAIEMTAPAPGKLFDPSGGETDLAAGRVRALHDGSFQDDATRILRAVRYSARFGFRLEERTHDLLVRDLSYLGTISGARIRQELSRTFAEGEPERALARLEELGVLRAIHPALAVSDAQVDATGELRRVRASAAATWPVLCWEVPANQIRDVARRLALTLVQQTSVEAVSAARSLESRLAQRPRPSEVVHLLQPLPIATLQALAVVSPSPEVRDVTTAYLTDWRSIRPVLHGDDLIELGVLRGPDVGDVLELLRAAKLDGEVTTRADEEHLVEEFLARERIGLA